MADENLEDRISAVRQFNRFFTRQIGVLREGLLHTPFSLTESRIVFELANHDQMTAAEMCRNLGLDPGYLSRILGTLEQRGLLEKLRSENDGRQLLIRLSPLGRDAFELLDKRSRVEVEEMLNELSEEEQQRLLKAMRVVENLLDKSKGFKFSEPFILRPYEPGDMGWVVHRHGVLYAQEYGWDSTFEALVAGVVADFVNNFKPGRENCWIAEMDGEIVGSVFLVQLNEEIAKLRLLLVEPRVRGLGLGSRLVEECIRFARRCHYKKITLWTNSVLLEARHIYRKTGFKVVASEEYHSFGKDLVSETWELDL
jgi:DNA-binding MarR family transcriptional regulator/N-acetylglutamate synthase-like GNAT family acetyltransferase